MIRVNVRFGDGQTSIEVAGHEEHQADGRVCAAATWITQAAVLGLEQLALSNPDLVSITITQE